MVHSKRLSLKRKNVPMNGPRNKRATLSDEVQVLTPPISPTVLTGRDSVTPRSSIGFLTEKNVGAENLSINRFQGLNPAMSMVDKGPVTITFPVPKNPGIFVVTGVLREHDMDIFKEGTDNISKLQTKSTVTLSFIDTETFNTSVGDQIRAIDAWIRAQPRFTLPEGRVFKSPYHEEEFSIDVTWAPYERLTGNSNMQRKTPLLPRKYEDKKATTKLSWDMVEKDSILRMTMTAYRDDKNRAYAGWTLNMLSVAVVCGPIGDIQNDRSGGVGIGVANQRVLEQRDLDLLELA